jgi:two-component system, cell cycle sensor histidine kinase and response regulator CckA
MQRKTGNILSSPMKTGTFKAPVDSPISYALCFEDAPIGMAITTMDGKVLHFNKALLSLTGYSKQEASRINAVHLYKNPQERERFISRLQKEKKIAKYETEFIHKDGLPIQISMTSTLITLGQEEAILTMVEDVTNNMRLEREMKIHEQAMTTSISAIAMSDLDGMLSYVNSACLVMWGYEDPSQVMGKAVASFFHSLEEALKILAEVHQKGMWAGELVAKRADGTTFEVQLAANVVKDKEGNPICLMSSLINVSERKRAERALRDSEHQYRMALDAMGDAIILVDRDLRIILVNKIIKKWCVISGISPDIEGLSLFDAFPFLHEDKVREEYKRVFDSGEAITTQDSIVIHEKEIFTETRKSPVFEKGKVVRVLTAIRDVTEKLRLERGLIESENKYRNIFENTLVGIYQSTLEGRYISANPAIARMFGYETPETFMASIANIGNQLYVNPSDRKRSMAVLERSDKLESFEVQTRRRDGSPMWNLINSRSVRDADGKIQYIEGVIIDTTKLKQTEEALRSSQEQFSKAFRSSPAPMVISTISDGRFIDVNRRFLDMLEYNRDELIGRTSGELGIWEDPELRHFGVASLQQNGSLREKPVRFRAKKGSYRNTLWSAELITIDSKKYMLSLIYDITEHKKTEQELREARHRLADIIDFLPDATLVIDRSGTVIAWNRAIEEMTGVPSSEMTGKGNYEYAIPFYGERRPILVDLILSSHDVLENQYKFIKREKDRIIVETDVPKVRGRKRVLWATAAPILNVHDEIVGAIESIRDTTDRRELEAQLIRAHKMESIGTLAGGIAHDFNNILTSIIGFTDMTIHELKDPDLVQNLGFVMKSCDRAKDLVRQILTFSRQSEQSKIPIEIDGFIKDSIKLIRSLLPTTIDIRIRINGKPSSVISDPAHIYQILMNLCTNAAYAMRENGGILEIALEKIAITGHEAATVSNLHAGDYVKISVSDTGHGISEAMIDRIFDPFFTTKPVGEGTGLGLSVVYGIVRDHGGSIKVQSAPGKGSTFHVYLPTTGSCPSPIEYFDEKLPQGCERILFVDDEDSIVQLGEQMLRSLGYEVTARSSSVEALEAFRIQPDKFDLVVTDMTMPNMTGLNLSKEILGIRPDMPIILCTGYSELVNENTFKQFGIKSFIMKPLSRKNIAAMVRQALDQ